MMLLGQILIDIALLGTIESALRNYPHQLAYFNELAGSPASGHRYLMGSNPDSGEGELRSVSETFSGFFPIRLSHLRLYRPSDIGVS